MSKILTRETFIEFLLGFLIGKIFGTVVSTWPFFEYLFDASLSDVFYYEFVANLLSFNGYHYALAIIGGLILVIWRSNDLFD
ncbi:MAG: hypothetical protein NWF07_13865 [Candidatus Bathyarchaeota archaeon]|nr:hypothetical protein [Candidatus Bathyarchaeota archaeon]